MNAAGIDESPEKVYVGDRAHGGGPSVTVLRALGNRSFFSIQRGSTRNELVP